MIAKTFTGVAAVATLALGVSAVTITPAAADPGAFVAGVIGGTALGAIAAGAGAPRYYPAPVEYAGPPPACWFERRPVLDPYGYVVGYRRTRVCE